MRRLAATVLILLGSIGTVCLGFLATFTVGAIAGDAGDAGSRIGALLVTAAPVLCAAAAVCGILASRRSVVRDGEVSRDPTVLLVGGTILLVLAGSCIAIGGSAVRIS